MRWGNVLSVSLLLGGLSVDATAAVDARSQRFITEVLALANAQVDTGRREELLIRAAGVQAQAGDSEAAKRSVAGIEDGRLQARATAAIAAGQALRGDIDAALATARHPERPDIEVFVLTRIAEARLAVRDAAGAAAIYARAREVAQGLPSEHARVRVRLMIAIAKSQSVSGTGDGAVGTLLTATRLLDDIQEDYQRDAVRSAIEEARQQVASDRRLLRPPYADRVAAAVEKMYDGEAVEKVIGAIPAGASRMAAYGAVALAHARAGRHGLLVSDSIAHAFASARDENDPYTLAQACLELALTMGEANAVLRDQGVNDRVSRIDSAMREAEIATDEVADPYFRAWALADVARAYLLLGDEAFH